MAVFLTDEWFKALQENVELFDPSVPEEKSITLNVTATDVSESMHPQLWISATGPTFAIVAESDHAEAEFRMSSDQAKNLVCNPSLEKVRSELVSGLFMARGNLGRAFELINLLETNERGQAFTKTVTSCTD